MIGKKCLLQKKENAAIARAYVEAYMTTQVFNVHGVQNASIKNVLI
jgi:hypothetical protein